MIRTAHQRAGLDDPEAPRQALNPVLIELLGGDPAIDGQVVAGRLKVLADGQDVGVGHRADVVHEREDLLVMLPDAHHDAGLREKAAPLDLPQHLEGAFVLRLRPNGGVHPAHRLEVVRQDLRPGVDDPPQRVGVAAEVAHQRFDRRIGAGLVHPLDGLGPDGGSAVGQIVAIDAGDHDVLEPHERHRLGDPARLVWIGWLGPAGLDVAEAAGARACVAEDHDRGRAPRPALAEIGAGGLLADGVQRVLVDDPPKPLVGGAARHAGADPGRLAAQVQVLNLRVGVVEHHPREAHHGPAHPPGGVAAERARMAGQGPGERARGPGVPGSAVELNVRGHVFRSLSSAGGRRGRVTSARRLGRRCASLGAPKENNVGTMPSRGEGQPALSCVLRNAG